MKVLVPTVYDTRGGSTRVLLASAAALRAEHRVVVRAPLAEADDPAPALFPSRPLVGLWRKLAVLPRLGGLVLREAGALRRLRPDLVHVHDEPSLYVYGLAARLVRPRPRILWHLHLDPSRGRLAALRGRLADACITISSHICAPTGLPASLIRNPLTLPDAIPEAAHDPLSSMAVVGAIYPQKGQDLAIHALAALRRHPAGGGARLTLIGPELDAAYAARLRATIQALGLTAAVDFAGPRAPARAFEGVGLALFPSRSEIQPLALAEALARGLPVVASDIPAHRVMIAETGGDPRGLCREDAEAMASALLDAASAAPPAGLAQRVRDLYSPHTFATDLLALYRTIAPRARS
ncbi:glycosyltransferase [Methylobacterium sp. Leaf466]|uniref:glycosyltransferase n=1 Tax=Methylobacterium sp. Leaf466 TaxID=1736386 RepID=UPI0006FA15C4|nr:glycosyltransferase [Methylobacterium sp. Leaf466]KQT81885.1 hypothetical protein ASG59_19125 [Methylobacterium sp. Leaf466]